MDDILSGQKDGEIWVDRFEEIAWGIESPGRSLRRVVVGEEVNLIRCSF